MADNTPSRPPSYLSPTKASLARYNPKLLSPSKSTNGKKALDYVLGRSDAPEAEQQQQEPETTVVVREPHELLSSTPGTRLQREVNKVIEDVEQNQTPQMARRFTNALDDEDDLPATPEGARYSPPRGILSSGPRRKRKRSPEEIVDIERPVTRARLSKESPTDPTQESTDTIAKRDNLAALKAQRDQLMKECTALRGILSPLVNKSGDQGLHIDELLPLLTSGKPPPSGAAAQPPISQQIASFLPFAPANANVDALTSPSPADEPVSCAPLPHSDLDDLLAHLQRFTPFNLKSEIESLSTDQQTGNDTRAQCVTVSAPHFTTKIILPITQSRTYTYLYDFRAPLEHVSPWAAPELGRLFQQMSRDTDFSMLHALGEYYEFAIKRAKTWVKLAFRFADYIKGQKPDSEEEYEVFLGRKSISLRDPGLWKMEFIWEPVFDEDTCELKDRVGARANLSSVEEYFKMCLERERDVHEAISATVNSVFES